MTEPSPETDPAFQQPGPLEDAPAGALLGELSLVLAEERAAKARAQLLATALHEQGVNWAKIGRAIGMSTAGAYQRWSPKGKEIHRRAQHRRSHPEPTDPDS